MRLVFPANTGREQVDSPFCLKPPKRQARARLQQFQTPALGPWTGEVGAAHRLARCPGTIQEGDSSCLPELGEGMVGAGRGGVLLTQAPRNSMSSVLCNHGITMDPKSPLVLPAEPPPEATVCPQPWEARPGAQRVSPQPSPGAGVRDFTLKVCLKAQRFPIAKKLFPS